jgi:hypothetical protein
MIHQRLDLGSETNGLYPCREGEGVDKGWLRALKYSNNYIENWEALNARLESQFPLRIRNETRSFEWEWNGMGNE